MPVDPRHVTVPALLAAICLVAMPPLRTDSTSREAPQICDLVRNGADRTGCHEPQVEQPSGHPARGEFAPALTAPTANPPAR